MEENYLLAKWLNNELSEIELEDFKKTLEYAEYEKIKNYSSLLRVPNFDEEKLLKTVIESKNKKVKAVSIYKSNFVKIAAVIVISLSIVFFAFQNFSTQTELALNGKKASFILPDDSEVVLNSGSILQYRKWNWDNNRKISLNGEAYFHVSKGKKFEVETSLGKVTVLGTQFNVKSRKNRFNIICFEGRVKVNYNKKEIILTHGMQVTFENGNQLNGFISNEKPDWMNNTISFQNESLENIKDEIERQYNISIELKIKNKNDHFSGKIPSNNIETALKIITTTFKLRCEKISETKMIFEEL